MPELPLSRRCRVLDMTNGTIQRPASVPGSTGTSSRSLGIRSTASGVAAEPRTALRHATTRSRDRSNLIRRARLCHDLVLRHETLDVEASGRVRSTGGGSPTPRALTPHKRGRSLDEQKKTSAQKH